MGWRWLRPSGRRWLRPQTAGARTGRRRHGAATTVWFGGIRVEGLATRGGGTCRHAAPGLSHCQTRQQRGYEQCRARCCYVSRHVSTFSPPILEEFVRSPIHNIFVSFEYRSDFTSDFRKYPIKFVHVPDLGEALEPGRQAGSRYSIRLQPTRYRAASMAGDQGSTMLRRCSCVRRPTGTSLWKARDVRGADADAGAQCRGWPEISEHGRAVVRAMSTDERELVWEMHRTHAHIRLSKRLRPTQARECVAHSKVTSSLSQSNMCVRAMHCGIVARKGVGRPAALALALAPCKSKMSN
jgi:hypothetical protein